jgi:hypothetical protein
MPIKYNVVQRGNPHKRNEPKKRYAQVNSDGEVSFKELGEAIIQLCSIHYTDVFDGIGSLRSNTGDGLGRKQNRSFRRFWLVPNRRRQQSAMIDSTKVIFTPGKGLKTMLNNLKFEEM